MCGVPGRSWPPWPSSARPGLLAQPEAQPVPETLPLRSHGHFRDKQRHTAWEAVPPDRHILGVSWDAASSHLIPAQDTLDLSPTPIISLGPEPAQKTAQAARRSGSWSHPKYPVRDSCCFLSQPWPCLSSSFTNPASSLCVCPERPSQPRAMLCPLLRLLRNPSCQSLLTLASLRCKAGFWSCPALKD